MRIRRGLLAIAVAACLPACGVAHHDIGELRFEQRLSRDVDVLFVLDDSPGMASFASSGLLDGARVFAEALQDTVISPLASVHVAVVSSDMTVPGGDDGVFWSTTESTSGCTTPDGSYLTWVPGQSSGLDALSVPFNCLAQGAKVGAPVQQPFAALLRVLDGTQTRNAPGFLRPNADLLIVFVASQDDCSPAMATAPSSPYQCARAGIACDQELPATLSTETPQQLTSCRSREDDQLINIDHVMEELQRPKDFLGQVFVVLIAAPPEPFRIGAGNATPSAPLSPGILPSCQEGTSPALPTVRLQQLTDNFRERQHATGSATCICSNDLDPRSALASCHDGDLPLRMGNAAQAMLARGRCLISAPRFAVGDGGTPVARCQVTMRSSIEGADAATESDVEVPACTGAGSGPYPCWSIVPDLTYCQDSGFALEVTAGPTSPPPRGLYRVDCGL